MPIYCKCNYKNVQFIEGCDDDCRTPLYIFFSLHDTNYDKMSLYLHDFGIRAALAQRLPKLKTKQKINK